MQTPHRMPGGSGPFEIIDALTVVGPWRDRHPDQAYGFDDLLAEHARYGISRRLTLHAEARDGVPDEGNAAIIRLAVLRDDTAPIWTALPPRRFGGQSAEHLLADAQSAGVAMLALFPETHGHHVAPWANRDLYGAMESVRLPLMLDLANAQGANARARYEEAHAVATAHPGLPIVLWNAFYMDERLQVPLLDACPNVRIGIATVFIPTWGIEQYTARYGPDRLIFGSNWPRQSPGPLLTYVLYAEVEDRAKAAILGGTIRTLAQDVRWPVHGFLAAPADGQPDRRAAGPGPEPPQATADGLLAGRDPAPERAAPWLDALDELRNPRRAPGEEGE